MNRGDTPVDQTYLCMQRAYIRHDHAAGYHASPVSVLEVMYMGRDEESGPLWRLREYETTPYNISSAQGKLSRSTFYNLAIHEYLYDLVSHWNEITDHLRDQGYGFWRDCPMSIGPDNFRWPPDLFPSVTPEWAEQVYALQNLTSRRQDVSYVGTPRPSMADLDLWPSWLEPAMTGTWQDSMTNYSPPEPNPMPHDANTIQVEFLPNGIIIPAHDLPSWREWNTEDEADEPPESDEPPEPPPTVWDMLEV